MILIEHSKLFLIPLVFNFELAQAYNTVNFLRSHRSEGSQDREDTATEERRADTFRTCTGNAEMGSALQRAELRDTERVDSCGT